MSRPTFLQGLRIVDLSMGWAGPLATRHLADMGAEVIKIESCERFDWFRGWEASQRWIDEGGPEKNPPFNCLNRNKLDVTLDLGTGKGRALLLALVAAADAVVENFAGSVLPKLKLGFEVFRRVKPDIVMLSMPGFGTTGPWKDYRAYGSTTEQAAGLPHLSGNAEWPPTMVHIALGDAVAGLNGAAGLLLALRHRHRTGEGQFVDLSHSECLFPLAAHGIAEQVLTGRPPPRLGNRSRLHAPHGAYPCRNGRWLVIQVQNEVQWQSMQALVGESLEGFGDVQDRLARNDGLDGAVAVWSARRTAERAMAELQSAGVPAGAVRNSRELCDEPHLVARKFWKMMDREYVGCIPHARAPYRVDGSPLEIEWPAPTLGQHNRQVLGGILGLAEDEIVDLERAGVIGTKPRMREADTK